MRGSRDRAAPREALGHNPLVSSSRLVRGVRWTWVVGLAVGVAACGASMGLDVLGGDAGSGSSSSSSGGSSSGAGSGGGSSSGGSGSSSSTSSGGSSSSTGSGGSSSTGGGSSGSGGSCPAPSQVVAGSSCSLDPSMPCSAEPVPDCQGTTTPSCTCQSHAWACVTSFPPCEGGPCPDPSQVVVGSSCSLDPSMPCSAEPVPDCQGTTTPSCTCQSRAWACVTSFPYCDGG
jgi:hypothetical protein